MESLYDAQVVKVDGDYYLAQGYEDDSEISMYREISDLFEFERDEIEKILEDIE